MRQRNDTDHTLTVGTDPVTVVEPGEELDHDVPVAGLTLLDREPELEPAQDTQTPDGQPAKPDRKPRTTTPSPRPEEATQ